MTRTDKARKIMNQASECHHEEGSMYTAIWETQDQALTGILKLRELGCECHCESEEDESWTMWTVII